MTDAQQLDIKQLTARRGQAKAACTRAKTYIESINICEASLIEIKHRKSKFEQCWDNFSAMQDQIEILQSEMENADDHESERTEFEQQYFLVIRKFDELITRLSPPIASPSTSYATNEVNEGSSLYAQVRLPRIDLPKFSGAYDEWFPFYDTFNSLIHSDLRLKNSQKFQYLKSSLQGDAATLIKSLEISDANYLEAWNMLKERYDSKRVIIQRHVRSIFELPALQRENSTGLRQLIDGILKHLRALKALGRSTHAWDDVIIYLLTNKLDNVTRKAWEVSIPGTDMPTLQQLLDFLSQRCRALETILKENPETHSTSKFTKGKGALSHVSVNAKTFCPSCKGNHHIYQCSSFLKLSVEDRISKASSLKLCLNCLRTTAHRAYACEWGCCKKCGKRHGTLLHRIENPPDGSVLNRNTENSTDSTNKQTQAASIVRQSLLPTTTDTILSTAVVFIKDKFGKEHACRAFLDPGSQSNFITERMLNILALNTRPTDIPVLGFNQSRAQVHREVDVEIKSRLNNYKTKINCLVIDNITTNIPLISFNRDTVTVPSNIKLADPEFHISAEIDLLIGVDAFWRLICIGQLRTSDSQPLFQKTHLGWILAGNIISTSSLRNARYCNFTVRDNLDSLLTRFWELDQGSYRNELSPDERYCDEHYSRTVQRNANGRFIVTLPIREGKLEQLGQSKDIATRRFYALERRLAKNPEIKAEYLRFMREYEELGHMREISASNEDIFPNYYLPHHAVVKENSLTTRLRVVFDASCKANTGISLNDVLLVGPTTQEDLFSILIRFRAHYYVMSADIAKMYRQVLVDSSQTPLQRIVWRDTPQDKLKTYELLTITYGTAPASFLATKTLQQIARSEAHRFPLGSAIVLRDLYVDDLLTGSNSLDELKIIRDEVIELLALAGFKLRKWLSNEVTVLRNLTDGSEDHAVLQLDKGEFTSTLGIKWNANHDHFQYDSNICHAGERATKRTILSAIAKIFDPLGLLGPIMLSAKIIMQRLWVLKVHWDEALPMEIYTAWKRLESEWSQLQGISIPRKIITSNKPLEIQIHGFSDASQDGYGACIYIRSTDEIGNHCVRLLCAKSRVSPLRNISLPRLELCGALLLAELASKVLKALHFNCNSIYFWTDSGIVLSWIQSPSRRWVTFVANRIGAIQELSGAARWQHVSGKENPADLISRGTTPVALKQSKLWWYGPSWLLDDASSWTKQSAFTPPQDLPEQRTISVAIAVTKDPPFYNRFSSFQKLLRVLAYCRRFIHNSRTANTRRLSGFLTRQEINDSTNTLIQLIQAESFPAELKILRAKAQLPKNSKLLHLNPFIKNNVIRVGGRLQNSKLPFDSKHPAILPAKNHVTQLILEYFHTRQLHAGAQGTLAAVREYYWPIAARNAIRKLIRRCITCFKASPQASQHIMGNLPAQRITPSRPFSIVGVDYCGPFYIREGIRRNTRKIKSYIIIFVCMSTKAIHIELVLDMTTEAYLAAFKRFISRRGRPSKIYSDNGTTFIGASNELRELREMFKNEERYSKIITTLGSEGISWQFIPPRAPHFGGIWESAVKATKHHLTRVAGEASLNYVQLYTLLTQVEAVLNSRPLTPLSSDPNDLSYISPAHFLIGTTLTSFPEADLTCTKQNLLSKWQHIEQLKQHFWHRWVKEYLHLCQQRTKWKQNQGPQLKVDDLVIVRDDNLPPLHWCMGRIETTHPGKDGVVRAATVKTTKGSFKRPATKLHVLPVQ